MQQLHLAFRNNSSEHIVNALITEYPDAVHIIDRKGRIPSNLIPIKDPKDFSMRHYFSTIVSERDEYISDIDVENENLKKQLRIAKTHIEEFESLVKRATDDDQRLHAMVKAEKSASQKLSETIELKTKEEKALKKQIKLLMEKNQKLQEFVDGEMKENKPQLSEIEAKDFTLLNKKIDELKDDLDYEKERFGSAQEKSNKEISDLSRSNETYKNNINKLVSYLSEVNNEMRFNKDEDLVKIVDFVVSSLKNKEKTKTESLAQKNELDDTKSKLEESKLALKSLSHDFQSVTSELKESNDSLRKQNETIDELRSIISKELNFEAKNNSVSSLVELSKVQIREIMQVNKTFEEGAQKSAERYKMLKTLHTESTEKVKHLQENEVALQAKLDVYEQKVTELETSFQEIKHASVREQKLLTPEKENAIAAYSELENKMNDQKQHYKDKLKALEIENSTKIEELTSCNENLMLTSKEHREIYERNREESEFSVKVLKESLREEKELRSNLLAEVKDIERSVGEEMKVHKVEVQDLETKIDELELSKANAVNKIGKLNFEITKARDEIKKLAQEVEKKKELEVSIKELEKTLKETQCSKKELEENLSTLEMRFSDEVRDREFENQRDKITIQDLMTMGENLKSRLANVKANSDKHIEDLEKERDEQTKSIANLKLNISTMEDMRAKQDERLMDLEKKRISDAEQADELKMQILEVEDMFREEILKHSNETEEFQKKISSLRMSNGSLEQQLRVEEIKLAQVQQLLEEQKEKLQNKTKEMHMVMEANDVELNESKVTIECLTESMATAQKDYDDEKAGYKIKIEVLEKAIEEEQEIRTGMKKELETIQEAVVNEMERGDEEVRRLKKELADASIQNCDLVKKLENDAVQFEAIISTLERQKEEHENEIRALEDELQENKMKVVELKRSGDGNQSPGHLHKRRESLDKRIAVLLASREREKVNA